MKDPRSRGRTLAAGLLAGTLALLLLRPWSGHAEPPPWPLARADVDLALACLGMGVVQPPLAELSDAELAELVSILARLVGAYGRRDFDSFLALRAPDLEFAAEARREHLGELRALCLELELDEQRLPGDWTGLLAAYWNAYYREPPVARFLPESATIDLHREALGPRSRDGWEAWEAEFETRCALRPGFRVRHRLMIPHRRSLADVAAEGRSLRWLDLELGFEAHDAARGWLCARFVWDGRAEEWFLHRAITVVDGALRDDRRHLVL